MSAWRIVFADCEQFFSARSDLCAGFVEFDWFSIVFGKVLRFSKTKKLEFSRRNLFGKSRMFRFSKIRGATFFQNARLAKSLSTKL
jgi:hypothetical protein